jgi:hypothetical protein
VRFQPRFFAFAREFGFVPRACNPAAVWEKGKVERAGVGYVRQNFWPLRSFTDLDDVNRQARQWLPETRRRSGPGILPYGRRGTGPDIAACEREHRNGAPKLVSDRYTG